MTLYPKVINSLKSKDLQIGDEVSDFDGNVWVVFESYYNDSISSIDVNGDCDIVWCTSGKSFKLKRWSNE